jgi:uncharacterized protein YecE (DUF72 family)
MAPTRGRSRPANQPAPIRVGIGGWNFAPWRGTFYPAGLPHARELEFASRQMTSIEINGTFYRHQTAASFSTWAGEAPEDFVFSVKAHRAATHGRASDDAGPAVERFLDSGLTALGSKLGPILWQFPHNRKFDPVLARNFLAHLPGKRGGLPLRHAIEARHPSFEDPAWLKLLRERNIACAIVESGKQALRHDLTADFCYLRLQRNAASEPEGYASAALDRWAALVTRWSQGKPTPDLPLSDPAHKPAAHHRGAFVYFISGDKAQAPVAARAFLGRLAKLTGRSEDQRKTAVLF